LGNAPADFIWILVALVADRSEEVSKGEAMSVKENNQTGKLNRRKFLGALGKGAVALAMPNILGVRAAIGAPESQQRRFVIHEDRFGRIFSELPAFAEPSPKLSEALLELGKPGGILDAKDNLGAGPLALIVDPTLNVDNPNNDTHTAGTTFMGQFIDHDLTFDLTSRLGVPTAPEQSPNSRDPSLDLDSVYGGGPIADAELYERVGQGRYPSKFRIETGGSFEDLPRRGKTAIIADPRNDENMIIAGLHVAFLLFHNKIVDRIAANDIELKLVAARSRREEPDELFRRARRLTTWHYQWMILNEFLPLFIGQVMVDDILRNGQRFYKPDAPFIPVEFQGAAYRFGHSMVRPSYRANFTSLDGKDLFLMIFDPSQENNPDPDDLRGGFRARRRFIGWPTFFNFGDGNVRPNKLIDTTISTPLFNLPLAAIPALNPPASPPTSLPQRNLLRHITWQLPSGQSIANQMKVPALSSDDLKELKDLGHNLDRSTPLWYYVLKEAEVMEKGLHLGPVGGRIVGEVIIGLLQLDRHSFLSDEPTWRPTLPQRNGQVTGDFRMVDFLSFAGVAQLR
jgi:Animal haem peroxidase